MLILTTSKGWAISSFDYTSKTALISSPLNAAYLLAENGGDGGDGGDGEGAGSEDGENSAEMDGEENGEENGEEDGEEDGENSAEMDAITAEMTASYSETENSSRERVAGNLQTGTWDQALNELENTWEQDLQAFYGSDTSVRNISLGQLQQTLGSLDQQTGQKSAIVYLASRQDSLEVLLVTADAAPARHSIPEAKREVLFKTAGQLLTQISHQGRTIGLAYLTPAKQIYQWIMAPIVPQLDRQKINNLIFVSDYGLRSIPMGVLHDGQQFLIEKYSISNSPGFSLIDPKFKSIRNSPVLAMGASTFTNQNPLPAVPVELNLITQNLGGGLSFLNQPFTIKNLISQRQQQPFEIVHLATHADFNSGSPDRSYIQFFDGQLLLRDLSQLGLNDPPVQLLVISACQSAVGNKNAELGFAGLAVKSGVDTVVASLWYVSDEGTLALMNEFYRHLRTAPIKAEALRQAQIAMIKGNIQIENGQLVTNQANSQTRIPLPPELANLNLSNLSHPYYWSAFTMIGSPW